MQTFLSIGIPARGEEESLEKTVDYIIKSTVWQNTHPKDKELIICVNGSRTQDDPTLLAAKRAAKKHQGIRVIILHAEGKNLAINTITRKANPRAKHIYFSDADVIVPRETIGKVLDVLKSEPEMKFSAPIIRTTASFVNPRKRTPTQALFTEALRLGAKEKIHQLTGMGYAADRAFLITHPLPETNHIGDDRYIQAKYNHLTRIVYNARVIFQQPTLRDYLAQRKRHKIQKARQEKEHPELSEEVARLKKIASPRNLTLIRQLSPKAKIGLIPNQIIEAIATMTYKREKTPWKVVPSTKLRKRA